MYRYAHINNCIHAHSPVCVNVHVIHSHLYHMYTHEYIYSYTSTIYINFTKA